MSICPCGSQLSYQHCCQPIHTNPQRASLPEQLMRARYAAHVLKLNQFVIQTYHPSCQATLDLSGIDASVALNWCSLTIIDAPAVQNDEGFVEFQACYLQEGQQHPLRERSRFLRENGCWYYIDGVYPAEMTKLGRNDPCHCGSGKKYKKCCG